MPVRIARTVVQIRSNWRDIYVSIRVKDRTNVLFAVFVSLKVTGERMTHPEKRRCSLIGSSLKAHMLTHQAEKPSFPCSYCPSVMARKSDLRYHIGKQHARQSQPLPCNKCDEDFPDKSVLVSLLLRRETIVSFRYSLRMHGKTHKGQTIHSCTHCEFSANTSQQLDDHMNKHRGTRPFQCSECGLMFAARADLRAHVTRTHRTAAASIMTTSPLNRPQRRAASLQHRFIGNSSAPEEEGQTEDDFRCPICHRQFTSARLLDRHTFAVHEPKQESYDEREYRVNDMADQRHPDDDDDVHDYADDELEEKEKGNNRSTIKSEHEQLEGGINESIHEGIAHGHEGEDDEDDLAPNVEDISEGDDELDHHLPTIKSISTANRKQVGRIQKLDEVIEGPILHRNHSINRSRPLTPLIR